MLLRRLLRCTMVLLGPALAGQETGLLAPIVDLPRARALQLGTRPVDDATEPPADAIIVSPDRAQRARLTPLREGRLRASLALSSDEGKTWSEETPLPADLAATHYLSAYAPDGRLVLVFRNRAAGGETDGDLVAWVGSWGDLTNGRAGHYRVRILTGDEQPIARTFEGLDNGALAVVADCVSAGASSSRSVRVQFTLDETDAIAFPPPRTHYKGREIARTMHWKGAPWLLRKTRQEEENVELLMQHLGVEPGQSVCDLGAGNGFHTLRLARIVGTTGRVLAVDIQQPMLTMLNKRAASADLTNIETILGTSPDPRLPPGSCDLILLVDVYHELSHPEHTLRHLRRALRPGGRLALVEFRSEDPEVPIKKLHKMSKKQILTELLPNGFRLVGEFDGLPWQHLMFFASEAVGGENAKK